MSTPSRKPASIKKNLHFKDFAYNTDMPIIKSAKKRVRSGARKRAMNLTTRKSMKEAVKKVAGTPSADSLRAAYKALDKAAKRNVIHPNKAARTKSRLSKIIAAQEK